MASRDFYAALGLSRTASQDEIQRAYRTLARKYHPDMNKDPQAEERFKEVSEAYQVLSDPELRKRYDRFGPDFRQVPEGVDPDTWRRSGGARTGTGGHQVRVDSDLGFGGFGASFGSIDLDDLLGGIFGRAGGFGRGGGDARSVRGADQEADLELSVEEAFRGGQRSFSISGSDGERVLDVTIPAGVTDGQRIRLAGQGGRGSGGATAGDLYLITRLKPHPRYRVDGRDLHVDLPLAPWEAVLGTTVAVETPGGQVKVKVPPGTSSGRRLRLRGQGFPNPRGTPGDLYAEARILVPERPSDAERKLFAELAAVSRFDPRDSTRRR